MLMIMLCNWILVLNLFGIERVFHLIETNESLLTGEQRLRNTTVAQRWIIQPKAETPMMNFGDTGQRYKSDNNC